MATRLPAAVVTIALVSLVVAGLVGTRAGESLGDDLTEDQLLALRQSGAADVANHMGSLGRTSTALGSSPQAAIAVQEFAEAHRELLEVPDDELVEDGEALVAHLEEQYVAPLREAGRQIQIRDVFPENGAGVYLQRNYAVDLGVVDEPEAIDDARDGSRWSDLHRVVHPVYRDVVERQGLVDLLLVEPDDGYVVYSVRKRPELGTSLRSGPFSGTPLATATDRVLDDPAGGTVISDVSFYDPALTTPIGAIASPITDDGGVVGVVVLVYETAPLTDILTAGGDWDAGGFPETGESYLIGADGTTRSDPRPFIEDSSSYLAAATGAGLLSAEEEAVIDVSGTTVLAQRAVDAAVNAGLSGDTSMEERRTLTDDKALSTTTAVPLEALDWWVVTEVGVEQSDSRIDDFRELLVVGYSILTVAITFLAVAWASRILRPVRAISERLASGQEDRDPIEVPTRSPLEFHRLAASFDSMSAALDQRQSQVAEARAERLGMLRQMLPPAVADRVAGDGIQALDEVPQATVAVVVVFGLGELVRVGGSSERERIDGALGELDDLAGRHGLARVKVVGDAYFAACGHDRPYIDHAPRAVAFAADACDAIREAATDTARRLDAGVGIHTGPVTVGMAGGARLLYDVWGRTVTAAHHLARRARRGQILVSEETRSMLPEGIDVGRTSDGGEPVWSVSASSVRGPA